MTTTAEHQAPDQYCAEGDHMMVMLEGHVPISLLIDLAAPAGPDSADILATEGGPDDAWWAKP